MEGNKKNELQSRREFFKSSAKAALPVIGAVLLASMPVVKASAVTGCGPGSCSTSCAPGCGRGCQGGCSGTCTRACMEGCFAGCTGDCGYTCSKSSR